VIYVIQEHYASHHHYDLRLEMDGALKSWAIPKEPPREPGIKRLAVEVEDHPLGYEEFEGIIPEGFYGAGEVKIWDRGEYELLERSEDKILINIRGQKLNGRYCLVRFKGDKVNWLFFKTKGGD
jgi:DNA ligase D-like protein (predicted 3'-phosphoesterase)